MSQQDLTADMLTRIRNAARNRRPSVNCLNNKLNRGVARVLAEEGYIVSHDVIDDGRQGILRIQMKYGPKGEQLLQEFSHGGHAPKSTPSEALRRAHRP